MNTAAEGTIRSFDWNRGTWSDTARYGLLEAVFCYRDSDRIPGGVAITGVIINPDSVEEYCIQSLAFPNTVDGKPVVDIETGCCENMLEFGEVAWPENLRYIGKAFFESTDFEDAIRNAVSVGGDSDTLAAITGSIAQAYYGVPYEIRLEALSRLDERLYGILAEFEKRFGA